MATDFKRGALVYNVDREDLDEDQDRISMVGDAKEHAEEEAKKFIRGKHDIEVSSVVCRERTSVAQNFDCEVRLKATDGYTKSRFQDHFL